jgi:uracil-DNA glycosylase
MPIHDDPDPAAWRDFIAQGKATLLEVKEVARDCRACRLWERATQTVFGEGPVQKAQIVLVGEQPGDHEDLAGKPFVGPAGRLLDDALDEAGIDRKTAYLTNVVKHFSFEQRGKRRIHKKPKADEIRACRPWMEAELLALEPELIVCLGATAAQAILGRGFRVTQQRGVVMTSSFGAVLATVHPSSILRAPDDETRRQEKARFIDDLRIAAASLAKAPAATASRR